MSDHDALVAAICADPDEDTPRLAYADFLEAIADPENERHDEMLEWIGGAFDPDDFRPEKATREMHRVLRDWRHGR